MKSNRAIDESLQAMCVCAYHEPFDDVPTPKTITDLHPVLICRAHILYSDNACELLARWKWDPIHNSDRHCRLHRRQTRHGPKHY